MKTPRWMAALLALNLVGLAVRGQVPEPSLPRPGSVVVADVIGEVTLTAGDQSRRLKADERVRVGVTLAAGRMSLATFELSNGTTFRLGSESELELEEFGQEPFSSSIKWKEEKEEPSISRTRLRLLSGDVTGEVRRLKTRRGSTFTLATPAGTLRMTEGTFYASVRMSEIGLGVCTIDLRTGTAEFEPLGGTFAPVAAGKRLAFALEPDRVTGALKIAPMPPPGEPKKAAPAGEAKK